MMGIPYEDYEYTQKLYAGDKRKILMRNDFHHIYRSASVASMSICYVNKWNISEDNHSFYVYISGLGMKSINYKK